MKNSFTMKYLRLFESFKDIDKICKQYYIKDYTINSDGSIDVNDSVDLDDLGLTKLPLKFNKINGDFDCRLNNLTSLEGSPEEINGSFLCKFNDLTSFKGSPKIIRGNFDCRSNNIKSFEYFPSFVKTNFWCLRNPINEVWVLFGDWTKIELLNDFDIFRDEDTDEPAIVMYRLNDFLLTIGKDIVEKVKGYKNI